MSQLISPKRGPKGSPIAVVHSVSFHRNGVGGQQFYAVEFNHRWEGKTMRMHAVVVNAETDADPNSLLEAFVTTPGQPDMCWRGIDYFGSALRDIVRASKWSHEVEREKAKKIAIKD